MAQFIQPTGMVRFTANGLAADGVEQTIGLPGFGATKEIPTNAINAGLGYFIPMQWEIINQSTTNAMRIKWGSVAMAAGVAPIMDNWINLGAGLGYYTQKRHVTQEMDLVLYTLDLQLLRVYGVGADVAFSVVVDCWAVYRSL